MLIPLNESDLDACIDFAYELALDLTRSAYPTYCDGIKTREDFAARARESLNSPDEEILLFAEDGEVEGWIAYECNVDEGVFHTLAFNTRKDVWKALAQFVGYCREIHPGFALDLGFPTDNIGAVAWLEGAGAVCLEQSQHFQFFLEQYAIRPDHSDVRRITEKNFEDFAAIHHTVEQDMYWNCERVRDTLDWWDVFVSGSASSPSAGELLMTGRDRLYEIFTLAFADGQFHRDAFVGLLTAALNTLRKRNAKCLVYFVPEGSPEGEFLPKMGFQLISHYVMYRLML